jgi:hypothetical protein
MAYDEVLVRRPRTIVSMALLAMLAGSIATIASPAMAPKVFAQGDDAVKFVTNVEMIKGHMSQVMKNAHANNYVLAQAHAGHPIAEHYALLQSQISEKDKTLDNNLKSALTDFAANINGTSPGEIRVHVAKISRMLTTAVSIVVPADTWTDFKFRAAIASTLLSNAKDEYSEGVVDGKLVQMVEYQDAEAFAARANVLFRTIQGKLPVQEATEAKELFANLKVSMKDARDPDKINTLTEQTIEEMQKGAGINFISSTTSSNEKTSGEYINNIRLLLSNVEKEYKEGNYTNADRLAVEAYLDNFEHIEGPLVAAGHKDLMEQIEQMMRVQLRNMIADKVPADQLSAHITAILGKLQEAEKALA